MNSSPTTIRMIEVLISSEPIVGPTEVTRRSSAAPKSDVSSARSRPNSVFSPIGAGDAVGPGAGDPVTSGATAPGLAVGPGLMTGVAAGVGDAVTVAVAAGLSGTAGPVSPGSG